MSLLSLLSINIKYLYLTPSSTSQITILLDESKVEELTGWLTVNNGEIVRGDKPRKKNSTPLSFSFQRIIFTTGSLTDIVLVFAMSFQIIVLFVIPSPIPEGY